MLENWVAVVAELERDAAELGEAAQLIRRRYLREVVEYGGMVSLDVIVAATDKLHGVRRGGKQQALTLADIRRRIKTGWCDQISLAEQYGILQADALALLAMLDAPKPDATPNQPDRLQRFIAQVELLHSKGAMDYEARNTLVRELNAAKSGDS